jgi:hypothetical protein
MATTSTASRPTTPRGAAMTLALGRLGRLSLHGLLVAVFIAVQAAALSHEFEHLLNRHDAPCGLHVAADHQVIVVAPPPPAAAPLAAASRSFSVSPQLPPPHLALPGDARAPPLLS